MPFHPTSWRSILTLCSHLSLGLPSGLLPSGFPIKALRASLVSHTCQMPCPSPSCFYHPNNIRRGVRIIKFIAMYFSPLLCSLSRLRPNRHPSLEHPHPTFPPQCKIPSFTTIQNNRQNYISVYLKLHIFG